VEGRGFVAKGAKQQELAEGARDQIFAPDDLSDSHQGIVDRARQLVGGNPIFAPDGAGGRTFAQMDKEEKGRISHRGVALRKLQEHFAAAAAAAAAVAPAAAEPLPAGAAAGKQDA